MTYTTALIFGEELEKVKHYYIDPIFIAHKKELGCRWVLVFCHDLCTCRIEKVPRSNFNYSGGEEVEVNRVIWVRLIL